MFSVSPNTESQYIIQNVLLICDQMRAVRQTHTLAGHQHLLCKRVIQACTHTHTHRLNCISTYYRSVPNNPISDFDKGQFMALNGCGPCADPVTASEFQLHIAEAQAWQLPCDWFILLLGMSPFSFAVSAGENVVMWVSPSHFGLWLTYLNEIISKL